MRAVRVPTIDDIAAANAVVAHYLEPTPVIESPALGDGVVLKAETFQPTGSFKVRGALAAIASALAAEPSTEFVTASAGNHGLGVAYAATIFGARATVVVPENASPAKRAELAKFDVSVIAVGSSYDEAEAYALEQAASGPRYVSPYNDPNTIAGQGSIVAELLDQVPDVRTIVVPVGGGGLASGIGLAAAAHRHLRVVGVQATASPAMTAALAGLGPVRVEPTLADGLAGNIELASVTVDLCRRHVDEIVGVTEDEIRAGMRFVAREHGLVVEGSAAVGVAALLHGQIAVAEGVIVVLLTGRNIALDVYSAVLTG